ncbi:hypothetical protein J2W71_001443 [Pseudomonas sp. 3400]|nr:hypothetical protein [Pseudomonas sp. 3400]
MTHRSRTLRLGNHRRSCLSPTQGQGGLLQPAG